MMETATVNPVAPPVINLIKQARFLVDTQGDKTDVVLPLSVWQQLLDWLEQLDDRLIVQEWLPRLKVGPKASGVLVWNDVEAEWSDEPIV
jgi:hypothetical protein